jgi:hypothetical protein
LKADCLVLDGDHKRFKVDADSVQASFAKSALHKALDNRRLSNTRGANNNDFQIQVWAPAH